MPHVEFNECGSGSSGVPSREALSIELWNEIQSYTPESVVTISRVCQSWRQRALADPLLWSTVNVSDPEHGPHRLTTYLNRSFERVHLFKLFMTLPERDKAK